MGMRALTTVVAVLVWWAASAIAAEQASTLGAVVVTIWIDDAPGRHPVVIFSHGFHGCATQSRFLTEGLAASGYLVIAPNHRDATCDGGSSHWSDPPEEKLGRPELWTDTVYRDRADDIFHIVDALRSGGPLGDRADLSLLALAGHSLGGYTVLGLAGAWPSWKGLQVKAVLALSPYSQPFIRQGTLAGLTAPVMYQGGTLDLGITPGVARVSGAYDQSPKPKYSIEFAGAGHLAWTNINPKFQGSILAYSRAFLDHYVKGVPASAALTRRDDDVHLLKWSSELGDSDSQKP